MPRHARMLASAAVAAALVAGSASTASAAPHTKTPYDVTFTSSVDTLPATFWPAAGHSAGHKGAAALIISGSGPADRNGNSPALPHLDTNLNFAKDLAAVGVSSLRYDKLGSGQTNFDHHPGGVGIDFDLYTQEALDAYKTMAAQPGVDPHQLVIVGHSEGGLIALWLADHLKGTALAPRAVILAAPLSVRYLDLLDEQTTASYRQQQAQGVIDEATANRYIQQMRDAFASIRAGHGVPTGLDDPQLAAFLNPTNVAFIAQADRYDPADLARQLGPCTPVLLLHGDDDMEVTTPQVQRVADALRPDWAARYVEIPDADHLFKIVTGVPNPPVDYLDATRPFSPEVGAVLSQFVRDALR